MSRETHVGGVDVEEGHVLAALVGERVRNTGGRCEERSGAAPNLVCAVRTEGETELPAEDVEGVGVPLVDVQVGARLAGRIAKPRQREHVPVGEEPEGLLRLVGHDLALAGA